MAHFVGLDVLVKETAVCVIGQVVKVLCEQTMPGPPAMAGQRLGSGRPAPDLHHDAAHEVIAKDAGNQRIRPALRAQLCHMMRVGLFKPVHVKAAASQEKRMLLTARKLVQRKTLDVDLDLRGALRTFGLKVGVVRHDLMLGNTI